MSTFYSIGRIQNYTQMQGAKSLWEQRKSNGYYTSIAENDPDRAYVQEQFDKMNSNPSDMELENIKTKLKRGDRLTIAEKEKLRTTDPELYEKANKLEAEQKQYEEDLKRCKTKEEVQRLKVNKVSASLSTIQSVSNNPNIPDATKLAIAEYELMRLEGINKVTTRFVYSGQYSNLPTESERNQAQKEVNEAIHGKDTVESEDTSKAPEENPEASKPAESVPKGDTAKENTNIDNVDKVNNPAPEPDMEKTVKLISARKVLNSYVKNSAKKDIDFSAEMFQPKNSKKL